MVFTYHLEHLGAPYPFPNDAVGRFAHPLGRWSTGQEMVDSDADAHLCLTQWCQASSQWFVHDMIHDCTAVVPYWENK